MKDLRDYEAMAKFNLPETERQWLAGRIEKLTDSFSALEKINTADIPPLVTVLDVENVMRNDEVKRIVTREELLSGAPEEQDGYFQVPKTLE